MLKLPENCRLKVKFDYTQSMSVSTQKLNEKGVGGSKVDIWSNVSSTITSSVSSVNQSDVLGTNKLELFKVSSASDPDNSVMSPGSPSPASPKLHESVPQIKSYVHSIEEKRDNSVVVDDIVVEGEALVIFEGKNSTNVNGYTDGEMSHSSEGNIDTTAGTMIATPRNFNDVSINNAKCDGADHDYSNSDDERKSDIIIIEQEETPGNNMLKKKKSIPL